MNKFEQDANYVLSNLCDYDERNPEGVASEYTKEELEKKWKDIKETGCYCDNCFYGRSKLAEMILSLI